MFCFLQFDTRCGKNCQWIDSNTLWFKADISAICIYKLTKMQCRLCCIVRCVHISGISCKISAKTADTMAFIDLQPTYQLQQHKLNIIVICSAGMMWNLLNLLIFDCLLMSTNGMRTIFSILSIHAYHYMDPCNSTNKTNANSTQIDIVNGLKITVPLPVCHWVLHCCYAD